MSNDDKIAAYDKITEESDLGFELIGVTVNSEYEEAMNELKSGHAFNTIYNHVSTLETRLSESVIRSRYQKDKIDRIKAIYAEIDYIENDPLPKNSEMISDGYVALIQLKKELKTLLGL